jgi:hypothetical protein
VVNYVAPTPLGVLDPEIIVTPGIYLQRVVSLTVAEQGPLKAVA